MIKKFEDFLLRNKIVNLKIRITHPDEMDIWKEAIDKVNIEFVSSHEEIHEDTILYPLDITICYDLKYSDYRKIINNLHQIDRTLMYDLKTRLTYIIIGKYSLQKNEAA